MIWGNVVRALHRGQAKTVTYVETMAKCIAQSPQVAVMLGMTTNEEPTSGSYVGKDTNEEPTSSSNSEGVAIPQPRVAGEDRYPG